MCLPTLPPRHPPGQYPRTKITPVILIDTQASISRIVCPHALANTHTHVVWMNVIRYLRQVRHCTLQLHRLKPRKSQSLGRRMLSCFFFFLWRTTVVFTYVCVTRRRLIGRDRYVLSRLFLAVAPRRSCSGLVRYNLVKQDFMRYLDWGYNVIIAVLSNTRNVAELMFVVLKAKLWWSCHYRYVNIPWISQIILSLTVAVLLSRR